MAATMGNSRYKVYKLQIFSTEKIAAKGSVFVKSAYCTMTHFYMIEITDLRKLLQSETIDASNCVSQLTVK